MLHENEFGRSLSSPASSAQQRAANPASAARCPRNLAEAFSLYEDAASDHPTRIKFRSAFRTVGLVLGAPLDQVPACAAELRPLLAKANPALAGVKLRQWRNVLSITKRGLRDLGIDVINDRDVTPLGPAWADLFETLSERRMQIGLARFMRFCTRKSVDPSLVGLETFEAYLGELETQSLHPNPRAAHRQTVRLWNRAADTVPAWPQLVVPVVLNQQWVALPPEAFPDAFRLDLEQFLSAGQRGDELDDGYAPRVRAITTKGRRHMILRLASALVHSGVAIEKIDSLEVLCRLEHARMAMRYFRDRHSQKTVTEGMLGHVWLLRVIARSWVHDVKADRALRDEIIRKYDKDLRAARSGVRLKNRQKLRQFDLPENLAALVNLPDKILRRVSAKGAPTYADSVHLMYACMVALLVQAPIRSKNLVELEVATNLVVAGKGRGRTMRLQLPPAVTKTRRAYEAPLSRDVLPLLDTWLKTHRQKISPFPSPYLFPNARGQLRNRNGLATQLTNFIERETGLRMHLHLFRHLAAKVILEHNPNHMEVARQVLGHSSRRTTERAYADFRGDSSFATFSAALDQIRSPAPPPKAPRPRSRR